MDSDKSERVLEDDEVTAAHERCDCGQVGVCPACLRADLYEVEHQRDMATAYIDTLRGAVLFALAKGKFDMDDVRAIKAALNDGAPIRA